MKTLPDFHSKGRKIPTTYSLLQMRFETAHAFHCQRRGNQRIFTKGMRGTCGNTRLKEHIYELVGGLCSGQIKACVRVAVPLLSNEEILLHVMGFYRPREKICMEACNTV